MALSLLERLAKRGDIAPATGGQTPIGSGALGDTMAWNSGFGGFQGLVDEELKKLMMQRMLQQQLTLQRQVPPGMQGGR